MTVPKVKMLVNVLRLADTFNQRKMKGSCLSKKPIKPIQKALSVRKCTKKVPRKLSYCWLHIIPFMHLGEAFIQSNLQCIQSTRFISMCVPSVWIIRNHSYEQISQYVLKMLNWETFYPTIWMFLNGALINLYQNFVVPPDIFWTGKSNNLTLRLHRTQPVQRDTTKDIRNTSEPNIILPFVHTGCCARRVRVYTV